MRRIFAIGASAGGVDALRLLLPGFNAGNHSVLVVLHLPPGAPNLLPDIFADGCNFVIKEAESGETMMPRTIYFAPPDYHLSAEIDGTLSLSTEEPVNYSRPSIDVMMESVALAFKEMAVGILLTGSNEDGAKGMKIIKDKGGLTLIQNLKEAEFPTMPASCLKRFTPDHEMTIDQMRAFISAAHIEGS